MSPLSRELLDITTRVEFRVATCMHLSLDYDSFYREEESTKSRTRC